MNKKGKSLQKKVQGRLANLHDSDVGSFNPKNQAKRIAKKKCFDLLIFNYQTERLVGIDWCHYVMWNVVTLCDNRLT